ncbi:calcium-binding protein E63-1-like [Brevipalpus obovatus]|uniref:calcium-binding protein E63-1-like n=1 Tax=Brevipalpus obovatus TaxID=246614 RepID=UPI003D9E99A1
MAQDKLELKNREKDLRDYFNSLANKEGKLDIPTFKHVLKQLGLHPEEGIVVETIDEIAHEGIISGDQLKEFIDAIEEKHANLRKLFDWIDADKNGYLDRYEIKMAFAMSDRPFTDEDVEKLMEECDTDRDGRISFIEFRTSRMSNLFTDIA